MVNIVVQLAFRGQKFGKSCLAQDAGSLLEQPSQRPFVESTVAPALPPGSGAGQRHVHGPLESQLYLQACFVGWWATSAGPVMLSPSLLASVSH